jgi:GNAT superfamily N-acetyltransferase
MTAPAITVRDARADDTPALAILITELGYPSEGEVIARRLRVLEDAGDRALVAERGGEVLGLITVHATPVLHRPTPVGRITMLIVTERARGTGVGRALVEAAERVCEERGCGLVELTSNVKRTDAHAFYARLGYAITSVRMMKPAPASG